MSDLSLPKSKCLICGELFIPTYGGFDGFIDGHPVRFCTTCLQTLKEKFHEDEEEFVCDEKDD